MKYFLQYQNEVKLPRVTMFSRLVQENINWTWVSQSIIMLLLEPKVSESLDGSLGIVSLIV